MPNNLTKTITGIAGATALIMGGVDASVLNEQPIERIEMIANERVEAKQVGNIVETTFPWKDQDGLKVKLDLGEPTLAERVADKRKQEVITETVTDFDGGFKVDILLNERPDTNVFCYAIEGAENYDFFYQPPLTEEEIAEGAIRPPEIEGSYAIYHKTLANHQLGKENYATGKVMHIPRPQVWSMSDVETKVWADMTYSDDEGLCVTVPQEFLDKAEYPVRVDPTFGYTIAGLSFVNMSGDIMNIGEYSTNGTGVVSSISGYTTDWGSVSNPVETKMIIYDSSWGLIADTDARSTTALETTWHTWNMAIGEEPTLDPDTSYRIAFWNDFNGGYYSRAYYDSSGTGYSTNETYTPTDPAPPDPLSPSATNTNLYSFYATYSCISGTCIDNYFTPGSYTWTPPTGITEVFIQCWGGGGGGDVVSASGGGGGGGGAYAAATTSVTSGVSYPVVVGAGGVGGTSPTTGADSTFGTTTVIADGGTQAVNNLNGTGGSLANSSGTIEYAGGNGSDGLTTGDIGGGGGGSAGPDGAGVTPSNATGGVGATGGGGNNGSGGAGGTGDSNGATAPGGGKGGDNALGGGGGGGGDDGDPGGNGGTVGGGGGGGEVTGTGTERGNGGSGQCTITYTIAGGGGGGATSTGQSIFWFD